MQSKSKSSARARVLMVGTSVVAMMAPLLLATPANAQDETMETVTVTGYRASLADSTNAKRASVSFSDSVFSEDIGKFPDTNIAESLNRIPGVTINRDINGEGVNVQIRGLGTNFTKVLLNGNPISVATTGSTDSSNSNREVDLNMFPTELFTQLTVSKSPTADQIEGGAAGSISMRSMRPFDKEGFHLSYNLQLTDQSTTNLGIGKRGALIISDTEGPFGFLLGVAGVQSNMMVTGFEDGNAGWVSPNLPAGACGAGNTCAQFGGNSWTIPSAVPTGVYVPVPTGYTMAAGYAPVVKNGVNYLPSGYPVNSALLYALNPGLAASGCSTTNPSQACINQSMTHLSNALLPRLGRPMFDMGSKDRYNGVFSFEYRPSDNLHFYFDTVMGQVDNHLNRSDLGWGVRGGNSATNMIPANLVLSQNWLNASSITGGLGGSVQSGTFYNATFGLEARDYRENGDFLNLNPGMSWYPTELLHVEVQLNYSRSHFMRRNPTIMVTSCTATAPTAGIDNCPNGAPELGTALQFDATGAYPTMNMNFDLNDPKNYEWNLGRINHTTERRYVTTQGAHLDLTYGGDELAIKVGAAYDVSNRLITTIDPSALWQATICASNPSSVILGPNTNMPSCTGQGAAATPVGWTNPYTGWGTGYSAGFAPLTFAGSAIPTSELYKYLTPGPTGFITANYDKIFSASKYYDYLKWGLNQSYCAPNCSNPGLPGNTLAFPVNANYIDERTTGLYAKTSGYFDIFDTRLKYDAGLRWVETRQSIMSPSNTVDARNATLDNGGKYPNYQTLSTANTKYHAFLPSGSLVYEVMENLQVRGSLSRTMTRANPGDMKATMDFGDPTVTSATLGNPKLKPFFSNNIDLGAEYYTGGEGYIGLTAFRKSIKGFTAQLVTMRNFAYLAQYGITWDTLGSTQRQNYELNGGPSGKPCNSDATCADQPLQVNQQVNLPGREIINGLEFNIVQPFDVLTEPYLGLTGFGFTGNVTYIDQRSTGQVATYATGVARWQYNMTTYYENNGAMIRLSYNWNSKVYGSSSNNQGVCLPAVASGAKETGCPGGAYIFGAPYGQADLSSSIKLANFLGEIPSDPDLSFNIQNLFNATQRSYIMWSDTPHTYYRKGMSFMLGLRGTF